MTTATAVGADTVAGARPADTAVPVAEAMEGALQEATKVREEEALPVAMAAGHLPVQAAQAADTAEAHAEDRAAAKVEAADTVLHLESRGKDKPVIIRFQPVFRQSYFFLSYFSYLIILA